MAASRRVNGGGPAPGFTPLRRVTPKRLSPRSSRSPRSAVSSSPRRRASASASPITFSCALHPSLSFFDHPPLSMLLGRLGLELAGRARPSRAPGALHRAVRRNDLALVPARGRLFGAWAGFAAALLLNLSPIFTLSVGLFFQPEGPLMFFWVACAWCLAHVLLGAPARRALGWWAAAGAMLGLRDAEQVRGRAPGRGRRPLRPHASRATSLASSPGTLPRPGDRARHLLAPSSSGMPSTAGCPSSSRARAASRTSRASGRTGFSRTSWARPS